MYSLSQDILLSELDSIDLLSCHSRLVQKLHYSQRQRSRSHVYRLRRISCSLDFDLSSSVLRSSFSARTHERRCEFVSRSTTRVDRTMNR